MVRIRPLSAAPGVQEKDMRVSTVARLMDSHDDTVYTEFFPAPQNAAAAQALSETDCHEPHVRNVGMTAAVVLAPGMRQFTVGKPTKCSEIYHFFVSSGHVNGRLLSEMVQQHGMTLTRVLQPCGYVWRQRAYRLGLRGGIHCAWGGLRDGAHRPG